LHVLAGFFYWARISAAQLGAKPHPAFAAHKKQGHSGELAIGKAFKNPKALLWRIDARSPQRP
jgi:hypothetical protein